MIDFANLAGFQSRQIDAWNLIKNPEYKYYLYGGAAGGGKSYFLRWAAIGLGMYYSMRYHLENVTIGLFSEDYPTLKDRQLIKMKTEIPPYIGHIKESRDEGLIFKSNPEYGSFVILLRNLDDPSKYASTEFAAELVEELTKNPRDTFDDLRFRLRYPGITDTKFIGATNPGGIGHAFVKQLWVNPDPNKPDPEAKKFIYVPAKVEDNKYLRDSDYIAQLDSLPEGKRKAYRDGSWDIFAGQVFDEWRENLHVITPFKIPDEWYKYISMDWGVNKPFSVNWYASNPDGRTYMYRELYMNGDGFYEKFKAPLTPKRLAKVIMKINEKSGDDYEYCVADPSMWNDDVHGKLKFASVGESKAEMMMRVGLKMIKGTNDRKNGLDRVRESLSIAPDGKPWLQIFKTCYDSVRTIPALVYNDKGANLEDVDTDGEDHVYDSLRYYVMSRPAKTPKIGKPKPNKIKLALMQHAYKNKMLEEAKYAQYNEM